MAQSNIGKQIQFYREQNGLTQERLAEMVDLTPNYLSAIERGAKSPRIETLIEIINALGVSADEIFLYDIKVGYKVKSSLLCEQIEALPPDEQRRIFAVIKTMIQEAEKPAEN